MTILYFFFFFLVGVGAGFYFNVIGKRLPNGEDIFNPEKCEHCGYEFHWYENIPLISFFKESGRCPKCHDKLDFVPILNELFTGFLFLLSYVVFGIDYDLFIALGIVSLLMIIVITDLNYYIIPDEILVFFNFYFMIVLFFQLGFNGFIGRLLSGIFLFGVMYFVMFLGDVIFKKESLGGGDVKMMFTFGLVLGPVIGLFSIFVSSFIALPVSILILSLNKDNLIPFGPFLLISLLLLFFMQIDTSMLFHLM